MRQAGTVGELDESVGYVLKQTAVALRGAMDAVLRPLELTVPQYACLELLGRQPGLSNADLARGTFVTPQSMNGVLRGLQDRGLITRPQTAPHGRVLPSRLTSTGRRRLVAASRAVHQVERRMLADLSSTDQHRLLDALARCTAALANVPEAPDAEDGSSRRERVGSRTPRSPDAGVPGRRSSVRAGAVGRR